MELYECMMKHAIFSWKFLAVISSWIIIKYQNKAQELHVEHVKERLIIFSGFNLSIFSYFIAMFIYILITYFMENGLI